MNLSHGIKDLLALCCPRSDVRSTDHVHLISFFKAIPSLIGGIFPTFSYYLNLLMFDCLTYTASPTPLELSLFLGLMN